MKYKFVVDKSLGKLSKWLRILGFDTIYEGDFEGTLFDQEFEPDRMILTRTLQVQAKFSMQPLVFIEPNDPQEQLKQVIVTLGLKKSDIKLFSRCLACNVHIFAVSKQQVFGRVPDYVFETNDTFQQCPNCNKIYWPGSHGVRIAERIEELFK